MGLGIFFVLLALGTGYLGRRSLDRAKRGQATLWWVLTPLLIFFAYAHLTYTGPSDDPMEKMRVELRMEMMARAKDPDSPKFDLGSTFRTASA